MSADNPQTSLGAGIDPELQSLIIAIEAAPAYLSAPVTLFLQGTVVSGQLCSTAEYFLLYGQRLAKALGIASDTEITKPWMERSDAARAMAQRKGGPRPPTFAHLKEGKIISGSIAIPAEGFLTRLKLTDVSGYALGALS